MTEDSNITTVGMATAALFIVKSAVHSHVYTAKGLAGVIMAFAEGAKGCVYPRAFCKPINEVGSYETEEELTKLLLDYAKSIEDKYKGGTCIYPTITIVFLKKQKLKKLEVSLIFETTKLVEYSVKSGESVDLEIYQMEHGKIEHTRIYSPDELYTPPVYDASGKRMRCGAPYDE